MDKRMAMFVCLLLVTSMVLPTLAVCAKKPENPGGGGSGGGPSATGTLFYHTYDDQDQLWVWTMDAEGKQKTKQTELVDGVGHLSRLQHGGYWWYIGFGSVDGTYLDGMPRQEIFAVRDDNAKTVQLTNDDKLETSDYSGLAWCIDDESISWTAKEWIYDSGAGTYTHGYGIYQQAINFDSSGDVTGLTGSPTQIFDCGSWYYGRGKTYLPAGRAHDWAPDGNRLVQYSTAAGGLSIVDIQQGTETLLTTGYYHRWSPDGSLIAFVKDDDLRIIKPDGTGEKVLVKNREGGWWEDIRAPAWSPDSKYISYLKTQQSHTMLVPHKTDIYYIGIDGADKTCLTKDLDQGLHKFNRDWR